MKKANNPIFQNRLKTLLAMTTSLWLGVTFSAYGESARQTLDAKQLEELQWNYENFALSDDKDVHAAIESGLITLREEQHYTAAEVSEPSILFKTLANDIGLIDINTFDYKSSKRFQNVFVAKGFDKLTNLVFDLRDNDGGVLQTIAVIAGAFIPKDTFMFQLKGKTDSQEFTATGALYRNDLNIYLLVNKGTSSGAVLLGIVLKNLAQATSIGVASDNIKPLNSLYPIGGGLMALFSTHSFVDKEGKELSDTKIIPDIIHSKAELESVLIDLIHNSEKR